MCIGILETSELLRAEVPEAEICFWAAAIDNEQR